MSVSRSSVSDKTRRHELSDIENENDQSFCFGSSISSRENKSQKALRIDPTFLLPFTKRGSASDIEPSRRVKGVLSFQPSSQKRRILVIPSPYISATNEDAAPLSGGISKWCFGEMAGKATSRK